MKGISSTEFMQQIDTLTLQEYRDKIKEFMQNNYILDKFSDPSFKGKGTAYDGLSNVQMTLILP